MTNDQPELDKIIAALRSSATNHELSGEDAALEAMTSTLVTTPGTVRSFGSARSLRVVAVVAASLIGMGGIAAAGAATLRPATLRPARDTGEISTADTVADTTIPDTTLPETTIPALPETTIPETTVPETTVPDTGDEPLVDDPATEFDETQCAEGNHGATVSSIAKATPPGPGHGDEVSIAAHSSCGKDATDDEADDATDGTLVDDPATEFDETQCAEGNHGATVSSIAKETPPGPGHGDEVSIAAHSSCGKDATDDTIADDGTETTVAATDDDSPGNSAGHGNSNGHGNGNSGGNGNGRGNGKPGG